MWVSLGKDIHIAVQELKLTFSPLYRVSLLAKSGRESVESLPVDHSLSQLEVDCVTSAFTPLARSSHMPLPNCSKAGK